MPIGRHGRLALGIIASMAALSTPFSTRPSIASTRRPIDPRARSAGRVIAPVDNPTGAQRERVSGAPNTVTAPIQYVRVDFGRLYILVSKQFLDSPYVVVIGQQVRGE
jgi:hypothetical protein